MAIMSQSNVMSNEKSALCCGMCMIFVTFSDTDPADEES